MRIARPLLLVTAAATFGSLAGASPWFSSGPPTGVASNRPYYNNCTTCHSGTVNSGAGGVSIGGVPPVYTPGMTYPITVTDSDPNARRWGFEIAAQRKNGAQAGIFNLTQPAATQLLTDSNGVQYVMHTQSGTAAGTVGPRTWDMEWVAPAAGAGDVVFAVSGNAANNNNFNNGDRIYNFAVSSAAPDGSIPGALVAAQPNLTNPRRGSAWIINARITNPQANAATCDVVSRIRMPNGSYFPPTGWLGGPISLNVAPGATSSARFTHNVPPSAPLVTATYEIYVRDAMGMVLDQDSFAFTVSP